MSQFDSLIIGEVAQDTNVDYDGTTVHAVGGAVYYSGFAANLVNSIKQPDGTLGSLSPGRWPPSLDNPPRRSRSSTM